MLVLNPKPANDVDVKKLRVWLNRPEARYLLDYLARKGSEHTALAGLALIGNNSVDSAAGPESNRDDAIVEADKARFYQAVIELLEEIKNPEKSLETVDILPKLTTNSQ